MSKTSQAAFDGLSDKIAEIRHFYDTSLSYPDVRALAESLSFDSRNALDIEGFFTKLKALTRYLPDPVGVELIKAPWVMVDEIHGHGVATGDCDDLAALAYSLLHSVGVPAELYVGWYGANEYPTHIFVGVPQKDHSYKAFDLVAPKYGVTKSGLSKVKAYA